VEKRDTEVLARPHPRFLLAEPEDQDLLAEACQEMICRALDFCQQKTRLPGHDTIAQALALGRPVVHDYFRYALAKEVGSYLGHVGAGVKAVYLPESESAPAESLPSDTRSASGLDLIVWVDEESDTLAPLVQALDGRLLGQYRALVGPIAKSLRSFLTVDIIDDRAVHERRGSGALITSIHQARPIKVWSRFVIRLDPDRCGQCRICSTVCPFDAITLSPGATSVKIDLDKCQLCGICYSVCPAGAIESAYYDFASLVRDVQSSVRANGFKSIALTCRGSTPTAEELVDILGSEDFVPICLPCVGRTPTEFFLKALDLGIERIAVIPCPDGHCRFEEGNRIIRSRVLLLQELLRGLGYGPDVLTLRQAEGTVAVVNEELCSGCGTCIGVCPYEAISADDRSGKVLPVARIDPALCQGCGACAAACPSKAIEMSRQGSGQILSQIEAALAAKREAGGTRVLGFRCNWCDLGDVELPYDQLHCSGPDIEVIRVPCVGRIDPLYVLWGFLNGADGVFLGGCSPDDCRYVSGSHHAEERTAKLKQLLAACGFDASRVRLAWLKRNNPDAFADAARDFVDHVRTLGPQAIH
jgi:coenzyme F420-reducing hydrogenase delta subunit/MinD superfamily P-loop ATPase